VAREQERDAAVDAVLARALARQSDDRYVSPTELAEALAAAVASA
jgi:hypothetical protein